MSNETTAPEIDLTSPEFIAELTPEQIAAAGEKKKYLDGSVYRFRNTAVSLQYSKPTLKNGEQNVDAKGSVWLQLELTPIRRDGSISGKLRPLGYTNVFFYDRLTEQAMMRVGYSAEQITKVKALALPDTFDMFRQFARAMFPERYGSYPRFDRDTKVWSYNGGVISEAQAKEIKEAEKNKVIAFQTEVRRNPKLVQGREAFWKVVFAEETDRRTGIKAKSPFASARYPSSLPHRKDGAELPVADPDVDFQQ